MKRPLRQLRRRATFKAQLFRTWPHHALTSNCSDALDVVEAEHRAHAVVELAIGDVKTKRSRTSPPASSRPTPPGR
jgi:hypothetical protein